MDTLSRGRQVLEIEAQGIRHVRALLDQSFQAAIELLLQSVKDGGKIVVTGIGKNMPIAEKIAATFSSTGAPAVVLNPVQALHGDVGILGERDVLLALSYSGATDEVLALLPHARRCGCCVISLTGAEDSSLSQFSDVSLAVTVPAEACPFNLAPTASTTATLAVGDALAMTLLEARGFQREDYARLHPAGAIGRSLLLRVGDIMRCGDRLAKIGCRDLVKDAVLAMTRAQAGAVAVVDAENKLLGIFTDGDLRRRLTDDLDILQRPIADVMTPDPLTVKEEQLAADVLAVFEHGKIDDLPVIDDEHKLVGAVDIQDLPKLKIM